MSLDDLDKLNIAELFDLALNVLGRSRTIQICFGKENSAEVAKAEIAAAMKSGGGG